MISQQALLDLLRAYWQTYRPADYSRLTNPETFFSTRAHEMTRELRVILTRMQPSPTSTDYLANLGDLNRSNSAAMEAALLELLPLPEATLPEMDGHDPGTQLVTEFLAELP